MNEELIDLLIERYFPHVFGIEEYHLNNNWVDCGTIGIGFVKNDDESILDYIFNDLRVNYRDLIENEFSYDRSYQLLEKLDISPTILKTGDISKIAKAANVTEKEVKKAIDQLILNDSELISLLFGASDEVVFADGWILFEFEK